jgi:hypothetical protein
LQQYELQKFGFWEFQYHQQWNCVFI